ncbi:MFS alpha-glucoside transporter [Cordyceps militaris]|uniref:MFS alpha-glucoside transporter n=1 Tax=Cordyceps militaris TaxID=73501 RepID=A0A2H4S597_CORMI|nr:MFS alpha-glucoside transporter [Cordyceps militaris]
MDDLQVNRDGMVLETKYAALGRWATVNVFWKAMLFCMILNWAALDDGFQQQIPGNVMPMPAFVKQMANTVIDGEPAISAQVISYFQGFAEMSRMFGYALGGILADICGRKGTMYISIGILLAGSLAEILAHDWRSWLGAACLIRFGVGSTTSCLITYVSEIAPFQIRGLAVGSYQLFLGVGQLISAIAAKIMTTSNPHQWKPLIAAEFLFTGILAIAMPFVPESPIYHARKYRHDKAKKCMLQLYGNVPDYDVEHEYKVIQHGIEVERRINHLREGVTFCDLFRGVNWKRTVAGAGGIMAQPLSGAPIVFTYSTYFFQVAHLDDPFLVTVVTGCTAMLLFNTGLATTGFFTSQGSGKVALAMLLLWVISYGLSAGPLGFVASGEVSTPRLRALSTSFNLFVYGVVFVVFQWTIPYMISPDEANLGVKAIYVWAGVLVPTIIVLYIYYPETRGRTYLELDELYERGVPARNRSSKQQLDLPTFGAVNPPQPPPDKGLPTQPPIVTSRHLEPRLQFNETIKIPTCHSILFTSTENMVPISFLLAWGILSKTVFLLLQLLNLLTFGLWSKVGRLTHYAFDAVLISAFLAGMKRSTGLTFKTEKVAGENKEANKWIDKYLGLGEWVMDQSVAIAGSSSFFERTR